MDAFTETEAIELVTFAVAFLIGVVVCTYVAIKETIELKNRRAAKRLIYEDAVRQEVARKKRKQERLAEEQARHEQQSGGTSFA